jgi:flagellar basal-body rod modification protein FlgD
MAIDVTNGSLASAALTPANPTSQMGKDDFLKLLVAQLKQQDPNNPMDAREMVAQLAQLSSVEKLGSIETNLTALRAESAGMASMQASGLIGRSVSANSNHLSLTSAGPAENAYQLNGRAASVQVTVRDASHNVVQQLDMGPQYPGTRSISWDGKDSAGMRVPNGMYTFDVVAKDQAGLPVSTSTTIAGVVSEVSYTSGLPELVVGNARVLLGDVVSIEK